LEVKVLYTADMGKYQRKATVSEVTGSARAGLVGIVFEGSE
jgi:DNA-binding protein YbaB